MSTRRSLKQTKASLKSSLKKSSKYREMLRRAARKFHLESLEDRRVFAIDPVLVAADGGVQFATGNQPMTVRNESPRELTFTFPGVPGIDRNTLAAGIRLIPSNGDGTFDAGDLPITPAYLDIGNDPTQVVMRFATPLKDDTYQIQFVGATLRDTTGLPFNSGSTFNVNFGLNLAPQIVAVVPQPVVRNGSGALVQLGNEVHVYLNNDKLDVAKAEDENYYRLLVTRGTVDPSDDAPSGTEVIPTSAVYDSVHNKVVLTFGSSNTRLESFAPPVAGVADPAVSFRLRVGTKEVRRPNVYGTTGGGSTTDWLTKDPGSTFDNATDLRNVLISGLPSGANLQSLEAFLNSTGNSPGNANVLQSGTSVIIGQSIDPQFYNLVWPGGNGDPGHRDVTVQNHAGSNLYTMINGRLQTVVVGSDGPEDHLGRMIALDPIRQPFATSDRVNGVTTYYYNFRTELGYVPDTTTGTIPTQPTFNLITERQKQRAREVLEIIGQVAGVNFVETEKEGFIIATGDLRAISVVATTPTGQVINTGAQTGPGGLTGLAGAVDLNNDGIGETAAAIMDAGEDWATGGADLFGNAWFYTAMHEISELLGLGHSYDLPGNTVQGQDPSLSNSVPVPERVYPGDADIAHMQHVYRPDSKDIDMYKFQIDVKGVFTAETFAERLANSSQLDSAISIYRVNPQTGLPELYSKNDDYFSKDSFIELELEPGTYYVGVSASGNTEYDPNVADSGMGGTTQGAYQLKLDFRKIATDSLTDATGIALDGDSDGVAGGVNNFWFRAAGLVQSLNDLQSNTRTARTIFVDRSATADIAPRDGNPDSASYIEDGSLARPFISIDNALAASKPFDIIRVVGNNLNSALDSVDTDLTNNLAYQIGFDRLGNPLADGASLDVPKDRTLMFEAGAVVQLRRAQISIGSENQGAGANRSGGALQVLGTPFNNVYFTSYNNAGGGEQQIGKAEGNPNDIADEGDWGGIAFRNDIDRADGRFDFERRGIFLNYVSHADIRYGGGQVVVNSQPRTVNPIHMTDARPTIINSKITLNADAAMSANANSFEESNFTSPQYGSTFNTSFNVDYKRVGPEIHGNYLNNNTVNALAIRARTQSGTVNANALEEMTVAGRFDDTDIVHVIQENLTMHSAPGGAFIHTQLTAPATTLVTAAPVAGTGGFAAGSNVEYKIVYVDNNGNEGVASNTVRVTGTITGTNSHVRLTQLPNITPELLAAGFVGRRLYRRVGGVGDFVLVEQIPYSASDIYVDRNVALPTSALKLKVASVTDSVSPRISGIAVTPAAANGTYAAGQQVVYGLAYVNTLGQESPLVELGAVTTLGPNGSVDLNNLPQAYGSYMGLRVYRSINGSQFDLVGLVDAGATTFRDLGVPVTPAQVIPATVNINAAIGAVPPPAGTTGFTNGTRVNYRFTFSGTGGQTASAGLAVPGGELGGFIVSGNNRQITLSNLPLIDTKVFSQLNIYRSNNYGKYELVSVIPAIPGFPQATTFVDTNPANAVPLYLGDAQLAQPANARARPHGSLVIDPSIVIKSDGARIDVGVGANLIAEGVKGRNIVMTSLYDQRYGAGGTFNTSKSTASVGSPGDWAGIYFSPDSKGSFNEVVFAYGGGESRIEGNFAGINVLEIDQAKVRVANSRFESNDSGVFGDQAPADRSGRGSNDNTTIFVRGAQPVIINNTAVNNSGSFISINVNALNSTQVTDWGRQTGHLAEIPLNTVRTRVDFPVSRLIDTQTSVTDIDNNGALVRLNKLDLNGTNGMRVRGGVLTTEVVWDDTDIVHVLFDSILIPDFHTLGGLRLESGARESLVVKSASNTNTGVIAGIIASGRPLDIEDRIGGTLQVLGQPGFPVVLTAYSDDTVSAGFTPAGKPQGNTNGDSLLPPLPTIGEVANGLVIDNDVAQNINGFFEYTVGPAGSYVAPNGSRATAQGLTQQFNAANLMTDYYPIVYAGGVAVDLKTTVTLQPTLSAPDVVVSEGEFLVGLKTIRWRATSSMANGSNRLSTSYQFSTLDGSALGDIRLISYMDQNVGATAADDLLYLYGSPGQADFRLLTLDSADRVGFAQGGIYSQGAGLQNAKYIGFTADKFGDLNTGLLAGTVNNFALTANPTGGVANIDLVDLPALADPALGNTFGLNDITTAMAWDITPTATTSTVTTFLEFFPRSPVTNGRPGEWRGLVIDPYANDRNVETVPEREPVASNGTQNSRPSKAQFLGSLAAADKGGDENLRLGFVVQGAIGTAKDVDIYSFKAKAETEVWFDLDRTSQSLDAVLELVDEFGNVLARSDNSTDEASGADSLIGDGAKRLQKTEPYEGLDLYSTNTRDPGFRIKLPGTPGVESTYFIRVRSVPKNKADLDTIVPASTNESLVVAGASSGAYELQVRLREKDEKGGSTVRYAKIANATIGIDVNGHPTHSPLSGTHRDSDATAPNNIAAQAQNLGNLLAMDRGAISVSGSLGVGDVDWFRFSLDYNDIDGSSLVPDEFPNLTTLVNTVFDLDYADGLGRPNLEMFVYDSNFQLILMNRDSNVADDRPGPLAGSGVNDLNRGSVGTNDAYIGNIALPATAPLSSANGAAPETYYVAIVAVGSQPTVLDQFTNPNSANPLLRLEPLDSVQRIVEDHLNEGTFANPRQPQKQDFPFPDRGTSQLPTQQILFDQAPGQGQVPGFDSSIPWTLGDVSMYIIRDISLDPNALQTTTGTINTSYLQTFNPFTGAHMTNVGSMGFDIEDIDFNTAGELFGLSRDHEPDGNPLIDADSGHLINISTANGAATDRGDDGIITYEADANGAPVVAHPTPNRVGYGIQYDAMSFFNPGGNPNVQRILAVGRRGEQYLGFDPNPEISDKSNIVYQLNPTTGAALTQVGPRVDGAGTSAYEAGIILTSQRFTAVEATTINPAPNNQSYVPVILDGTQFTVSDGLTTQVFEFNAGFEVSQQIDVSNDFTVRDGEFFILDRDTDATNGNEVIYHYDTGAVLAVGQFTTSNQIPDGTVFTVQGRNAAGTNLQLNFEFDSNNATNPGNVPVNSSGIQTANAIATNIANAINARSNINTFPVTASVSPGSTRVNLLPMVAGNPTNATVLPQPGLDPGEFYVEGGTGNAPILQAVPSPAAGPGSLEGRIFTLQIGGTPAGNVVFEFDPQNDGVQAGRTAVNVGYNQSSVQVATAMAAAIDGTAEFSGRAYGDRVVVNGQQIRFVYDATETTIVNLLGLQSEGGRENYVINAEENFTAQQFTTATLNAINNAPSPFRAGGETGLNTGRINFPPITIPGVATPTARIDITGMPLWTQLTGSTPDVAAGAISVPFFAQDAAIDIAASVESAIDGNLAGFNASALGIYVELDRGQISLPNGSPFIVEGEGPGGNITGIVNTGNVGNESYFVAVSDEGGLYYVTVNHQVNLVALPGLAKRSTVTTEYIGQSQADLSGIRFQGLSRGPANVEGGRYENTWFAVADGAGAAVGPTVTFNHQENNNSINQAQATGITQGGASIATMTNGFIGDGAFGATSGDYDFYSFTAGAGQRVTIEVNAAGLGVGTLADSHVTLYSSGGAFISQDDNGGTGFDSRLEFTVGAAGTYYFAVRSGGAGTANLTSPFNASSGSGAAFTGSYEVTVTKEDFGLSRLYAFEYEPDNAYTGLQPIFVEGQNNIPLTYRLGNVTLPIDNAKGVHFSQLDSNLWNMTPFDNTTNPYYRQLDPGHGTPDVVNGSRPDQTGNSSYHFGRGVGNNYAFNNGAHGTIISNDVNLEGYSAADQPVLYFTYYSAHETTAYDSFRVFVSGIKDNNADRNGDGVADTNSGDWYPVSMDDMTVVPRILTDTTVELNVPVQPNFTNTGNWRQVRIPLDKWAGQKDVRFRLDFSTAGDMDTGVAFTTGEELRAVAGEYITDGQFISIAGQRYEFNNGISGTFSSGRATPDGERLTVTVGGAPLTFEFDKNGLTSGGSLAVAINDLMTPQQVAQAMLTTMLNNGLTDAGLGASISHLGPAGTVSDAILNFFAATDVVVTPAVVGGTPVTQLSGDTGLVNAGAIEIPYQRGWTKIQVANSINAVLERDFYDQKLVVAEGTAYRDGQRFTLTDPNNPLNTQIFEFDLGVSMAIPTGGASALLPPTARVNDQDTFTITYTVNGVPQTETFELDSDNTVTPGRIAIPFSLNDTQSLVANSITTVLNATFLGMNAQVVTGGRIQFDTDGTANTTVDFTADPNPVVAAKYPTSGAAGVAAGNQPVYVTASNLFTPGDVAAAVASAINAVNTLGNVTASTAVTSPNRVILVSPNDYTEPATAQPPGVPAPNISFELTNVVANDNVKQYGDLLRLISSPTGIQRTIDIDPITLIPYRGPLGWEAALPGDQPDTPPGNLVLNGFRSNLRGQNNAFEGIYVDDFVIGLAERGEMVANANANSAGINVPGTPPVGQVVLGDYQLEIRRGVGYDFVAPPFPSFTPNSNDRFSESQTILARPGAEILDGQTFTLSDGNRQLTFEFNDTNELAPFGVDVVTPGNQEIPFNSTMRAEEIAVAIRDAINGTDVQQILKIDAWLGDGTQPGLLTTSNRVNLNGAASLVATGLPVTEPNQNIATALPITAAGTVYDGTRFFANGTIGDSDDNTTSQDDAGRRARDVDYFGVDLQAGQQILVDVDAANQGSSLNAYLRIFNDVGVLQNVFINGETFTAENDGPTVAMRRVAGPVFPQVTLVAPGERIGDTQVIGNTFSTRASTDPYLNFVAPTAGRYYIAVSGAGNNRYNPVTGEGAIPGSTGKYTLEVTSPNAPNSNSAGAPSGIDIITFDQELGDRNLVRDQGQLVLQGNEIYNSLQFGIDIDAGPRSAADGNAPHQGPTRNLSQTNSAGLVPGVVVMNNVIYNNGAGAISFSGDTGADAPVAYGRIINNTLYGQGGTLNPPATPVNDIGIRVNERSGPTMLNNIIANFATGIDVDASSRPNTVIGGIVTQGNAVLSNPSTIGFGDFPILLSDTRDANGVLVDPLFKNPEGGNFYLEAFSKAIDSSVDSLLDRPVMTTIRSPLGLGNSPIISPDRDSRGQVRADDPDVQTPQGFGLNPFKDRGAIDRVDKVGPSSGLVNPQDNDSFGVDRDPATTVVSTDNTTIVRNFTIALFDRTDPNGEPDGSDIDDFSVTSNQVIVTRRTSATTVEVLVDGEDYFFSYDATSNQIVITPVGNVWARGTYQIMLNDGIVDQAGNPLSANNEVALVNPNDPDDTINHYYTVFLGTAVDYGDAPAGYPVLDADGGANHGVAPGVYIGNAPSADFDGKPSASALLDENDDGVQFIKLMPGAANGSRIIVNSPTAGLKLSAWFDNDGTLGWSTAERAITNYVLQAGANTIDFTMPAGLRGATYARFRVSTSDIMEPTGALPDGEVEDYQVTLTGPEFQNSRSILVTYPGDLNPTNVGRLDVNNDGRITAFDALVVINYLNAYFAQSLPITNPPPGRQPVLAPPPYLDTNGDGNLTAFDAGAVINHLNKIPLTAPSGGEDVGFSSMSGGEDSQDASGELLDANYAARDFGPAVMYASSSVVIESVPTVVPAERLHDAAVQMMVQTVSAPTPESQLAAYEEFEAVEVSGQELTDGQWAELLEDLAEEQVNLG
jgi:hypothetical protein